MTDRIRVSSRELEPGIFELRIDGSLDWSNFHKLEEAIAAIFSKGVYQIVINLRGAKQISSVGYGCFVSALDKAIEKGGAVVFAAASPEIQDVFSILGLSKILHFTDDEHQAVELLKK
ncbi:MAG: STAS domain-containing protein [Planctomycetes bacterium]|nr:STAS domain-containing protein [Planctomycetota bacterium]